MDETNNININLNKNGQILKPNKGLSPNELDDVKNIFVLVLLSAVELVKANEKIKKDIANCEDYNTNFLQSLNDKLDKKYNEMKKLPNNDENDKAAINAFEQKISMISFNVQNKEFQLKADWQEKMEPIASSDAASMQTAYVAQDDYFAIKI